MQKQRMISTKFWSDGWVREHLNQLGRYFFLYFLTNEHTKICGIYELPLSTMAFETGFERDTLIDTMLPQVEPKVYYFKGWVIMPNFLKHQNSKSPTVQAGIVAELKNVPEEIMTKAIEYGYPIDTLSHLNLNLNSNLNPLLFDEWWKLYPSERRVNKELCRTKYEDRLTEAEHKRRLDHLKEQIEKDIKFLTGYIPLTTTYLNQSRWDMAIELGRRNGSQGTTKIK